jgi:hypothetical protein
MDPRDLPDAAVPGDDSRLRLGEPQPDHPRDAAFDHRRRRWRRWRRRRRRWWWRRRRRWRRGWRWRWRRRNANVNRRGHEGMLRAVVRVVPGDGERERVAVSVGKKASVETHRVAWVGRRGVLFRAGVRPANGCPGRNGQFVGRKRVVGDRNDRVAWPAGGTPRLRRCMARGGQQHEQTEQRQREPSPHLNPSYDLRPSVGSLRKCAAEPGFARLSPHATSEIDAGERAPFAGSRSVC